MKLQQWMIEKLLTQDDKLIYKQAGIDQAIWVRDSLSWVIQSSLRGQIGDEVWAIVGSHTSKSVLLPVYKFTAGEVSVKLRCNFYDWCVRFNGFDVSLSDFPVWMDIQHEQGFYEGMGGGKTPFEFCVTSRDKLFAILWWLFNEGLIDFNSDTGIPVSVTDPLFTA